MRTFVLVGGEGAAVVPVMVMAGPLAGWAMAAVAVLVPSLVAVVAALRWPPRQELWATYNGSRVTLLRTRDSLAFGKASRALQRAIESLPVHP